MKKIEGPEEARFTPRIMAERNTDHLMRQLDIIPMEKLGESITVIGAGAIGSFTVLALVKMGFENITVYDFDKVSVENMNCQWYRFKDIGKQKVEALADLIYDFTGVGIKVMNEKFDGNPVQVAELGRIVITAVDSMLVRTAIWGVCKDNPRVYWYIDPRMAAEYAMSYVMNPNNTKDIGSYEKTLYSDENAVQETCTAKATMYTATMIAGYVAKHVKDIVCGEKFARVTHWDIKMNNLSNWEGAERV